jgi:hypothetical protein
MNFQNYFNSTLGRIVQQTYTYIQFAYCTLSCLVNTKPKALITEIKVYE